MAIKACRAVIPARHLLTSVIVSSLFSVYSLIVVDGGRWKGEGKWPYTVRRNLLYVVQWCHMAFSYWLRPIFADSPGNHNGHGMAMIHDDPISLASRESDRPNSVAPFQDGRKATPGLVERPPSNSMQHVPMQPPPQPPIPQHSMHSHFQPMAGPGHDTKPAMFDFHVSIQLVSRRKGTSKGTSKGSSIHCSSCMCTEHILLTKLLHQAQRSRSGQSGPDPTNFSTDLEF